MDGEDYEELNDGKTLFQERAGNRDSEGHLVYHVKV